MSQLKEDIYIMWGAWINNYPKWKVWPRLSKVFLSYQMSWFFLVFAQVILVGHVVSTVHGRILFPIRIEKSLIITLVVWHERIIWINPQMFQS